jgi:mTERF domain-containing protein
MGLRKCDIAPRLEFWIGFVGSFDKLLPALKGNNGILMSDLDKVVKPNIALLQECGLSVCEIAKLSTLKWTVLSLSPERVKASVLCVEKLVVPRSSDRFKHVLKSACWISEDMLAMKMEFLRSTLGCSEDKLRAAVCISPHIFYLSDKNLCRKIDFLISEVGLEREFIVERPWVLGYSLEKRMVPRHSVMKILRTMGLMKDAVDFSSSLVYSEKKFVARYIDPYKQAAPTLADSYAAACAGKMPAHVHR